MTKNNILQEENARKTSLSELNGKNIGKLKKFYLQFIFWVKHNSFPLIFLQRY